MDKSDIPQLIARSNFDKIVEEEILNVCKLADCGSAYDDPPCNYLYDKPDFNDLALLDVTTKTIGTLNNAKELNNPQIHNTKSSLDNLIEKDAVSGNMLQKEFKEIEKSFFENNHIDTNNKVIEWKEGEIPINLEKFRSYNSSPNMKYGESPDSSSNHRTVDSSNIDVYDDMSNAPSISNSKSKSQFQLPSNLLQKCDDITNLMRACDWRTADIESTESINSNSSSSSSGIRSTSSASKVLEQLGFFRPQLDWIKYLLEGRKSEESSSNVASIEADRDVEVSNPWDQLISNNNDDDDENIDLHPIVKSIVGVGVNVKAFDKAINILLDGVDHQTSLSAEKKYDLRPSGYGPLSLGCGAYLISTGTVNERATRVLSLLLNQQFSRAPLLVVTKKSDLLVFRQVFQPSNLRMTFYDGNSTDRAKQRNKMMNGYGLYLADSLNENQPRSVLLTCYEWLLTDFIFFKSYLWDLCILDDCEGMFSISRHAYIVNEISNLRIRQMVLTSPLSVCSSGSSGSSCGCALSGGFLVKSHPIRALQLLLPINLGRLNSSTAIDLINLISALTIVDVGSTRNENDEWEKNILESLPWLVWTGLYPTLTYDHLLSVISKSVIDEILSKFGTIQGIKFDANINDTSLVDEIDKALLTFKQHDEDSEVPAKASKKRNRGRENEAVVALLKNSSKTKKTDTKTKRGVFGIETQFEKNLLIKSGRYHVTIEQNNRSRYLGSYDTREKAELVFEQGMNQLSQWDEVVSHMNLQNGQDLTMVDPNRLIECVLERSIALMMSTNKYVADNSWDAPDHMPSSYAALYSKKGEWAFIYTRKCILGKAYASTLENISRLGIAQRFGLAFFDSPEGDSSRTMTYHIDDHPSISRKHAIIEWSSSIKKFSIRALRDCVIHVNGDEVTASSGPKDLENKTRLQIGSQNFYFLLPCELPENAAVMAPLEQRYRIIKTLNSNSSGSTCNKASFSSLVVENGRKCAISAPPKMYKSSKSKFAKNNRDWFDPLYTGMTKRVAIPQSNNQSVNKSRDNRIIGKHTEVFSGTAVQIVAGGSNVNGNVNVRVVESSTNQLREPLVKPQQTTQPPQPKQQQQSRQVQPQMKHLLKQQKNEDSSAPFKKRNKTSMDMENSGLDDAISSVVTSNLPAERERNTGILLNFKGHDEVDMSSKKSCATEKQSNLNPHTTVTINRKEVISHQHTVQNKSNLIRSNLPDKVIHMKHNISDPFSGVNHNNKQSSLNTAIQVKKARTNKIKTNERSIFTYGSLVKSSFDDRKDEVQQILAVWESHRNSGIMGTNEGLLFLEGDGATGVAIPQMYSQSFEVPGTNRHYEKLFRSSEMDRLLWGDEGSGDLLYSTFSLPYLEYPCRKQKYEVSLPK